MEMEDKQMLVGKLILVDKQMLVDMAGEDMQLAGEEGMKMVDTLPNEVGTKDMMMELGRTLLDVGKEP